MKPEEKTLVIAFTGLSRYRKISARTSGADLFELVAGLAERVGEAVDQAGGRFIKQMGDESLLAFDESQAASGVAALRALKATVDDWLVSRGLESELLVRVNIGKVAVGMIGPAGDQRLDIIGRVVNDTAMMKQGPFVVSPGLEKIIAS